MKQRFITLLLAMALCLSLAACDEETGLPDDPPENAAGQTESAVIDADVSEEGALEVDGMTLGAGLEEGEAIAELDENPNRAIRRSTRPIETSEWIPLN